MDAGKRYHVNSNEDEHEVLPNKLGLTELDKVQKEEARGFIDASVQLMFAVDSDTKFDKLRT